MSNNNLDWRNVHGIDFEPCGKDETTENKAKVLVEIQRGNVTVEESWLARKVLHIHEWNDYVYIFYTEEDAEEEFNKMRRVSRIESGQRGRRHKTALRRCEEMYDPDLPDITDTTQMVAYCV